MKIKAKFYFMYQDKMLFKTALLLIPMLLITSSLIAQSISERDKRAVRELSKEYKKAIASSKGENLYPLVSESSIEFYNKVRSLTLFAQKEELLKEDLHIVLLTMLTKKLYDFGTLRAMDAKEFFIDSFTGQSSTFNQGEDITVNEFIPNGEIRIIVKYNKQSDDSPFFLPYIKENNEWKVDIADFWRIYLGTMYMEAYEKARDEGYSKEQFILYITREQFGITEDNPFKRLTLW